MVQRLLQAVEEQRPVRQAGQHVVEGAVGQLLLESLALADVAPGAGQADDVALVVLEGHASQLVGHRGAVGPDDTPLDLHPAALVGAPQGTGDDGAVLRGEQVDNGATQQLLPRQA
jgi:hypothetical protein